MSTPAFLRRLERETRVRLKPSSVCDGIGVFAIQPIAVGTDIFPGIRADVPTRFISDEELASVECEEVRRMVTDFCLQRVEGGKAGRWVYTDLFCMMDMSFYLNSAEEGLGANVQMYHDPRSTLCAFRALRDIAKDEELLFDYNKAPAQQ